MITHTSAPTQTQPSYKQKYSYITDGNVLPYDKVPPKPKPAPVQPTAPGGTIIGEYELNTGKVNTFGEFNTGPVLFTGNVSPEGIINVDIQTNETITKLSTEPQLIAAVDGNLRALPKNIVTIDLDQSTNEDKAKLFVKLRIEGELGQTLEAQQANTIPEQVYEAFTEEAEQSKQESIDAEQAASEGDNVDLSKIKRDDSEDAPSEYRMVGVADDDRMTNAELEAFKAWRDKYVPGIPFKELDNIIQVNDTEQAWGVFENGVAKFVRGGLKGTEYHEVFEGIWASVLK